eukprot:1338986-Amphidinium_carterae.1
MSPYRTALPTEGADLSCHQADMSRMARKIQSQLAHQFGVIVLTVPFLRKALKIVFPLGSSFMDCYGGA